MFWCQTTINDTPLPNKLFENDDFDISNENNVIEMNQMKTTSNVIICIYNDDDIMIWFNRISILLKSNIVVHVLNQNYLLNEINLYIFIH